MTPAYAGFIASFGFGAAVVGALVGGALGDRWGRKRTIITSVVAYSLGSFLCALAPSPEWFAAFRLLAGVGMGMTLQNEAGPRLRVLPAALSPDGGRQRHHRHAVGRDTVRPDRALANRAIWLAVGLFRRRVAAAARAGPDHRHAGSPLDAGRQEADGDAFDPCSARLRPDIKTDDDDEFLYPKASQKSSLANVFAESRARSAVLFWVVYFMNIFVIYGTNTWIPKLMMDSGYGLGTSLWLLMALFVGALVASPIIGHFADRCGSKPVSLVCYVVAFCSILALCLPTGIYLTTLFVLLAGGCTMGIQNLTHAYISLYFPPAVKSTMMGWGLSIGRTGGLLGPIVGGVLLSLHATLFVSFLAFAVPCLISALAVYFIQDQYAYMTHWAKAPAAGETPVPGLGE